MRLILRGRCDVMLLTNAGQMRDEEDNKQGHFNRIGPTMNLCYAEGKNYTIIHTPTLFSGNVCVVENISFRNNIYIYIYQNID